MAFCSQPPPASVTAQNSAQTESETGEVWPLCAGGHRKWRSCANTEPDELCSPVTVIFMVKVVSGKKATPISG